MGTLMATSMIPRLAISPFADVLVVRADRKWIIVFMDVINGIFIAEVAIFAFMHLLKIWKVFLAGIIAGICAAFFNPAARSSILDIIPKEKIVQGNSLFSLIYTGFGIFGSAGGEL
ncbi:MAG: MFS transporter, partial [Exilispira sp.]